MAIYNTDKNNLGFGFGLNVSVGKPLDSRVICDDISDLGLFNKGVLYVGLIVYVINDGSLYVCTNTNSTNDSPAIWNKIETGSEFSLPIATESTLGGVKVGSNLSITTDGVLSADSNNTTSDTKVANMRTLSQVAEKYSNNIPENYSFNEFIKDIYRNVLDPQDPASSTAGSLANLSLSMNASRGEFNSTITGKSISKATLTLPTMYSVSTITDGETSLSGSDLKVAITNGPSSNIIYRSKANYSTTITSSEWELLGDDQKSNYYPTWDKSDIRSNNDYKVYKSTDSTISDNDEEVTLSSNKFTLPSITLTKPSDSSLTKTYYTDYYYAKESFTDSKTDKLCYNTYAEDVTSKLKVVGATRSNSPLRTSVTGYYPGYTNASIYGSSAKVSNGAASIGTEGTTGDLSKSGDYFNSVSDFYFKPGGINAANPSTNWEVFYVALLKCDKVFKYDSALTKTYAELSVSTSLIEDTDWYVLLDGSAGLPEKLPTTDDTNPTTGTNYTSEEITEWKNGRVQYCKLSFNLSATPDTNPTAMKIHLTTR